VDRWQELYLGSIKEMEKLHISDVKGKCTSRINIYEAEIPRLKWSGGSVRSSESAREAF
jgi:hypothetical protein